MSHFLVVVMTKDGTETEVKQLMAPFDSRLKVEPYDEICDCGSNRLRSIATEAAKIAGFDLKQMADEFSERTDVIALRDIGHISENNAPIEQRLDELWKLHIKPLVNFKATFYAKYPELGKPVANCKRCRGTGLRPMTYNLNSKWDYWYLNKQWNDTSQVYEQVDHNWRAVADLLNHDGEGQSFIPFALVTPDGEWIESSDPDRWQMVTNKKYDDEWQASVMKLYERYSDCKAFLVDCHV